MSYLVLARKYRPQTFDEVIGQEHITDLLKKSITAQRLGQAFLFCGPRGIGKTSCARIFAKSINCQKGPTPKPCGTCPACVGIASGNSFDVIEIDGASNRGIDEIRALRENVKFSPGSFRYKVYIIDEVHMLTAEAFNALLKTLEEPPSHVKFIFATTEPQKLPETIISRCQRFDFKRMSVDAIYRQLSEVIEKEKISAESDALHAMAKAAMGSCRDALSILDQLSALGQEKIKVKDVSLMLGVVETELIFKLVDSLIDKNCAKTLETLEHILSEGKDVGQLSRDLIEHFRHLMVVKVSGKSLGHLIDYPIATKEMLFGQAQKISLSDILKAVDILLQSQEDSRVLDSWRTCLEIALAKITYKELEASKENKEPSQSRPTIKSGTFDMISNKKGHLDFSMPIKPKPSLGQEQAIKDLPCAQTSEQPKDVQCPQEIQGSQAPIVSMDLQSIRKLWDTLTFAVSRKKMSLATYLQDGLPCEVSESKIVVGFSQEAIFHKETLESRQNTSLIESIIGEHLKRQVRLEFKIIQQDSGKQEDPAVKEMLDKFQGKVIHRWHQHNP